MSIVAKLKDPEWVADKYHRIGVWVLLISGAIFLALIPMRAVLNVADVIMVPGDVPAFSAYGFMLMTTLGFGGIPVGLSMVLTARAMRKKDEGKTKEQHYLLVAWRMVYILFLSLAAFPLCVLISVIMQF